MLNIRLSHLIKYISFLLGFFLIFYCLGTAHSFLSTSYPIPAKTMAVEGWLPDTYLSLIQQEFIKGRYNCLITLGGEITDSSVKKYSKHLSWAEFAANKFIDFGIDKKMVFAVPSEGTSNHKTLNSYIALRNWLYCTNYPIREVNIVTAHVHAKKSYTLCKKVLGPDFKIGVIAIPPQEYNSKYWFLSARGIRLVIKNYYGYVQALLLCH